MEETGATFFPNLLSRYNGLIQIMLMIAYTVALKTKYKRSSARKIRAYAILMKHNTPVHLFVLKKEVSYFHRMIRSARFSYERRLALASSKSPKIYFACVRGKPELRHDAHIWDRWFLVIIYIFITILLYVT